MGSAGNALVALWSRNGGGGSTRLALARSNADLEAASLGGAQHAGLRPASLVSALHDSQAWEQTRVSRREAGDSGEKELTHSALARWLGSSCVPTERSGQGFCRAKPTARRGRELAPAPASIAAVPFLSFSVPFASFCGACILSRSEREFLRSLHSFPFREGVFAELAFFPFPRGSFCGACILSRSEREFLRRL
jgi:hypothetical protein